MSLARLEPRQDLLERLRAETREIAGFDIYDVRWDTGKTLPDGRKLPGRDCLCIFEKTRRGTDIVRKALRHPATDPQAKRKFEYLGPDGQEMVTEIPLGPDDPDYEQKVLGLPRQLTEQDVEDCIAAANHRVRLSKAVAKKLKTQHEEQNRRVEVYRDELAGETAEELMRVLKQERTGKNPFIDLGHRTYQPEGPLNENGYVVVDRRKVV